MFKNILNKSNLLLKNNNYNTKSLNFLTIFNKQFNQPVKRKEIQIFVNDKPIKVDSSYTIFQACIEAGEVIPRFCYHEKLSVAGNCRMCLVEVEKAPKPIASCAMPVMDGMRVNTKSERTQIARGGVMEFLLANHPLDCPICDQGGECDLQDIYMEYGYEKGRFMEYKRGVEDKEIGPIVKTTMTRCIHCTRCIRFSEEVAGSFSLGTTGRGRATEVGTYVENLHFSELSGNIVDLCPVGALTNKPYAFKARPWELKSVPSIDIFDTILPPVDIDARGIEVMRVLPRIDEEVNDEWISDKSRQAFDSNKRQRLTMPMIKNNKGELIDVDWDKAFEKVGEAFNKVSNPNEIKALIGDSACLESITALRDLMHGLGVENISLGNNSLNVDSTVRNSYIMNSKIRGIEDADLLILVGTNPKYESPVLNARIRKAVNKGSLKVGLVGNPYDLTYDYKHLGSTTDTIKSLLEGNHPFCKKIKKAKLPMILIGSSVFKNTSENSNELYNLLNMLSKLGGFVDSSKNWNGFNVLHNQVSTIGALDLGIKPYVNSTNTPNISNESKLVYLMNYDDIKKEDIPKDAFVIYQGTHGDKGAEIADIVLPGASYLEKNSTYVSTEGRVDTTKLIVSPPYLARDDWEILRALSEVLDVEMNYDDIFAVRDRMLELAPHLVKTNNIESNRLQDISFDLSEKGSIEVKNRVFDDEIDNFYINNAMTRASPTMAKCSHQLNKKRFTNFKSLYNN